MSFQQAPPSPGSFQAFAGHDLPRILDTLLQSDREVLACQRLGTACLRTLGLPAVEITRRAERGGEGVLFAASADGRFEEPTRVLTAPGRRLLLRVAVPDDTQWRWLQPILFAALSMVDVGPSAAAGHAGVPEQPSGLPRLPEPETLDGQVGEIYDQALRIARGEIAVLIRGGSGCGKEVLAKFIHRASQRAGEAFLALNCAALPRDLLEAELFGVERGVATGVDARPGLFERAHGGTLFLDEVGDMAPDTQAKILRVMQEGEVNRLGSARPRPARARILAATNRDLGTMIEQGLFRRDLFHRLTYWQVTLPALSQRRADIPNLAVYFLDRECRRLGVRTGGLTRSAMATLLAYPWPGNVRQLERQMVRSALFLGDGEPLDRVHLDGLAHRQPPPGGLDGFLESVERRAIEQALAAAGGDVGRAAERLDLGRSTLYRRVKHLGIAVGE